jgi:hypothetical protein
MTTKLPTKAQVVEAFNAEIASVGLWLNGSGHVVSVGGEEAIPALADILVRKGLAEEPREEGWYWVRWRCGSNWQVACWRGDNWATGMKPSIAHGSAYWMNEMGEPFKIGPRIHPPKE